MTEKCEWVEKSNLPDDEDEEFREYEYNTNCGHYHEFDWGVDIKYENDFKYCPYCGGEITVKEVKE